MKHTCGLQKR